MTLQPSPLLSHLENFNNLLTHYNLSISLPKECDDDCENIQPVTATNSDGHSTFSFGAPTSQDGVKQSFGQGGGFNFAETGNLPQSNRR